MYQDFVFSCVQALYAFIALKKAQKIERYLKIPHIRMIPHVLMQLP